MIRLHMNLPSHSLLHPVEIEIGLPSGMNRGKPPYKTLWALHPLMSDGNIFFEYLNAADLIDKYGFALIAPSLGGGYFLNTAFERQADFLAEFYAEIGEILAISGEREKNTVLGISMGGFGAMRWAVSSDYFSRAVSISGVFSSELPEDDRLMQNHKLRALYAVSSEARRARLMDANGVTLPDADFSRLIENYSERFSVPFPEIFLYCGQEDYLGLPQAEYFENLCKNRNIHVSLTFAPGSHDLAYWQVAFGEAVKKLYDKKLVQT